MYSKMKSVKLLLALSIHTKLCGNRPDRSGEEDFKGFLPYMGMAAILVMCPASCHQIFIFLYLKAFIKKMVKIDTVFFEKIPFELSYEHDLGPRSRNDLDLQYSHTFIYLIRLLLLLFFQITGCNIF